MRCARRSTRARRGTLLVGHSYGGAVVTDAGVHPRVEHVAYLTAFALDAGESVVTNGVPGGEDMQLPDGLESTCRPASCA